MAESCRSQGHGTCQLWVALGSRGNPWVRGVRGPWVKGMGKMCPKVRDEKGCPRVRDGKLDAYR